MGRTGNQRLAPLCASVLLLTCLTGGTAHAQRYEQDETGDVQSMDEDDSPDAATAYDRGYDDEGYAERGSSRWYDDDRSERRAQPRRSPAPLGTPGPGYGPGSADGPSLQCVPYARQVSGIRIYGNALTWWNQAAGHYARGRAPKVGAVMSFRPHGQMLLGHVAAVSKVIDSRTVLLRHANWSLIGGKRGQIENDVPAYDTSPDNDWSQVRVWFAPIQSLGGTSWPVNGFIYPQRIDGASGPVRQDWSGAMTTLASADTRPARTLLAYAAPIAHPRRLAPAPVSLVGADFLSDVRSAKPAAAKHATTFATAAKGLRKAPQPVVRDAYFGPVEASAADHRRIARADGDDPIGRIIAARMR